MASGIHLTEDEVYVLAGNIYKQGAEALEEKEKAHMDLARK